VAIFEDEATAREALNYEEGAIQSHEFRDCFNDYLDDNAESGVNYGDVRVGQVSFPQMGQRSSSWEVVIPVESQGFSVSGYAEAVLILQGQALAVVQFSDVGSPFDEQMREDLARTVADRMVQSQDS
jgi:hypothetical protein